MKNQFSFVIIICENILTTASDGCGDSLRYVGTKAATVMMTIVAILDHSPDAPFYQGMGY